MSEFATLTVEKRSATGKGAGRRLRAAGLIPAVFYTPGGENIPVQVPELPLVKIFETKGRTTLFNVEIVDGDKKSVHPALIWDVEFYPTKNRFMHVDFFGVDLEKELKVRVPVEYVGTAKGTKLGAAMQVFVEAIDLICKPLALPSKITIDVTNLDVNQSIKVGALGLAEGVRAALDSSVTMVSVASSSKAEADEDGEAKGE
ncbi:50S ribosomal protein L25/general stress protein Ctc [Desulfovibrio sp. OttesenSCG-928-I05]|nr:50S ribosomal protein L25/general stress protein Ctc [Desulfovibrio sp. OttesenSCG-928-I05]